MSHVNQAEIARLLGISQSTVSIGLKGDTRVAKKTREAIQLKAAELGYVPDPNLFALSSYRKRRKGEKVVAGMGWLTNHPTRDGWKGGQFMLAYHKGAVEQAQKLGYHLYEFWLGDPKISPERLKQIMLARGIRGLVIPPQFTFNTEINFDFSLHAAVSLGHSLRSPRLHVVTSYQHQLVRLAYENLQRLGYRRIGLFLNDAIDQRVDRNFSGGYFALNPMGTNREFIEPYWHESFDETEFDSWFGRWRPEAVIVTGGIIGRLEDWMQARGLSRGKDLAYAELNLTSTDGEVAGVSQQSELIGKAAVNVLDSLLNHFEYGIPGQPFLTLVEGVWCDGASAPPR